VPQKKTAKLFLSELCQISTNCENVWHTDGEEDRLMQGTLISTSPNSSQCKHGCSKLLHNAVIISLHKTFWRFN